MIVECPKCHSKYEVEDSYIPIGGAPIRCPNCSNIFGIYVEPIDIPLTPVSVNKSYKETETEKKKTPKEDIKEAPPQPSNENIADIFNKMNEPDANESPVQESTMKPEPSLKPSSDKQPASMEEYFNQQNQGTFSNIPENENKPEFDMNVFGEIPSTEKETSNFENTQQPTEIPSPEPQHAPPSFDNFAMPEPKPEPQQTPPSFDDFAMPEPKPEPQPTPPSFDDFAMPEPKPEPQPTPPSFDDFAMPEPKPEPQPTFPSADDFTKQTAAEPAVKKPGVGMFDSLYAGFSLPANFSNLPESIQKEHKNAVKLARQLAKDILLYHKDEVEKGIQSGNLKEVLKDEVGKSFKFYSQRISNEILDNTHYFSEALNKIIGKGQKLF